MTTDAAAIRARIDHPVIDGDGHLVEFLPLVRDFMVELGGESLGAGLDRLLAGPGLLRPLGAVERLDDIGLDLAVLYPTFGLIPMALDDEEVRRGVARACNRYYAEVYADYADRLL